MKKTIVVLLVDELQLATRTRMHLQDLQLKGLFPIITLLPIAVAATVKDEHLKGNNTINCQLNHPTSDKLHRGSFEDEIKGLEPISQEPTQQQLPAKTSCTFGNVIAIYLWDPKDGLTHQCQHTCQLDEAL